MDGLSKWIVKNRNKILVLAILLLIPSIFGYLHTRINYDILSYLPKECESMKGQQILDEQYQLASVGLMVTNDLSDQEIEKDVQGQGAGLWHFQKRCCRMQWNNSCMQMMRR